MTYELDSWSPTVLAVYRLTWTSTLGCLGRQEFLPTYAQMAADVSILNPELISSAVVGWKSTQNPGILSFSEEDNSVRPHLPRTRHLTQVRLPDWFDVLDERNLPLLTQRKVLRNLEASYHDRPRQDRQIACSQGRHRSLIQRESQSLVGPACDALQG